MENNMPLFCPVCLKDDRIFKVSAVYSGGVSHGTFSSSEGSVSATSQTVLSGKLTPLPKPSSSCFVIGCSGLCIATGIFLLFVIGFLLLAPSFLGENVDYSDPDVLGFNVNLGFAGVFWLVVGLGIYLLASSSIKRKMPHWITAMEVWNRCYYCGRDGIVFDPSNGSTIPVDSFDAYLKKW
jgi:hypothetical protein